MLALKHDHHLKRNVIARNKREKTSVFSKFPSCKIITIEEAEMAYHVCSRVSENQKDDCYIQFGIDRVRTEKYLEAVKKLEDVYQRKSIVDVIVDFNKLFIPMSITLIKTLFYIAFE